MRTHHLFWLSLVLIATPAALRSEAPTAAKTFLFDPVDPSRERTVPVKVYLTPSDSPRPVVIFSHGLGGSRENSAYLANYWADRGYVAVFVQHAGSDEEVWKSVERGERMAALKSAASLQAALARYADIPFVIDQLEEWNVSPEHTLKGKLDLEHIGLCGHSFGAMTTQALMGQRYPMVAKTFLDTRIDAFFVMSPSTSRGITPEKAFGHITAPVLCMTGTEDNSPITPETTPESRREVYTALPAGNKYQLIFEGGNHFAFSDTGVFDEKRQAHHHPAIQQISTHFWDAYLKGDAAAKNWLKSATPRTTCTLLEKDVWEWK
ncbi:MAG: hypothetical protein KA152_01000 [Verrucomicrobiales bacterium]|nr:hypothetical protein [Verrucomicrobiales bacterium]